MGNLNGKLSNGKCKRRDRKRSKSKSRNKNKFEEIVKPKRSNAKKPRKIEEEIIEEDFELLRIRNDLHNNLDMFVLDNVLMAIQFLENFERDVKWLRHNVSVSSEAEKWNIKLSDQFKHAVSSTKLGELVGKHVRFKHLHGPNKNLTEMLINPETLIVHDNVDVNDTPDGVSYSIVRDGKIYQFKMECSSPGYMKLRSIVNSPRSSFDHLRKKFLNQRSLEDVTYDQLNGSERGSEISEESKISSESSTNNRDRGTRTPVPIPQMTNGNSHSNDEDEENFNGEGNNFIQDLSERLKLLNKPRIFKSDPNLSIQNSAPIRKLSFPSKSLGPGSSLMLNSLQDPQFVTDTERKLSGILKPPKQSSFNFRKVQQQRPIFTKKSPVEEHDIETPSSINTDYGYSRIKHFATPRNVNERRLFCRQLLPGEWPPECFYKMTVEKLNNKDYLFQTRYYADSSIFMEFFKDDFIEKIAEIMNFSDEFIREATTQGCDIFCDRNEKESNRLTVRNKIIPALFCGQWPRVANEFYKRKRNNVQIGKQQTWPNSMVLDEIFNCGCYLFPVGRMPSRGGNEKAHLEWQLAFPKVERILETYLSHEHLNIYLFTIVLYKRFLEPLNEYSLGLQINHIKTLMFWQAEHCFDKWKENQLGQALSEFLKLIYRSLKKSVLPDYILRQRDLFESIPKGNLRKAQAFLFKIQENLLIHVLQALRNIHYTDEFYPVLDFKQIYDIISIDKSIKLINPKFLEIEDNNNDEESELNSFSSSETDSEHENIWKEVRIHDPIREWRMNVRKKIQQERKKIKTTRERGISIDSIYVTDIRKKSDNIRRYKLLDLFIPHFIDMAKRSLTYRTANQANNYLKHAERLATLLNEEDFTNNQAQNYLSTIKVIQETMVQPSTSKYNGLGPAPGINPFRENINNFGIISSSPIENIKHFTPDNVRNINIIENAVSGRRRASRITINLNKNEDDVDVLIPIKRDSYIIHGPNYQHEHSVKVEIHNEDLATIESSDL